MDVHKIKKAHIVIAILFLLISCKSKPEGLSDPSLPVSKDPNDIGLFFAVQQSRETVVLYYLKKGADPSVCDGYNQTALMWACQNGNLNIVKALFEVGSRDPKPNAINRGYYTVDSGGYTALLRAAYVGQYNIIEYLMNKGAKADAKDDNEETAFHKIVKSGNSVCLDKFLQKMIGDKKYAKFLKGSINNADKSGFTPLHYAVKNGNLPMLDLLITEGADINSSVQAGMEHPLYTAYMNKRTDLFKRILSIPEITKKIKLENIETPPIDGKRVTLESLLMKNHDIYWEMFEERKRIADWKPGMELGKDINELQKAFCDAVLKNPVGDVSESIKEAKQALEKRGLTLAGVDREQKISLLEIAIQNQNLSLLKYLMPRGEQSVGYNHGSADSVLFYAIKEFQKSTNSKDEQKRLFDIIEWLVADAHNHDDIYTIKQHKNDDHKYSWMLILDSNLENVEWKRLSGIMDVYHQGLLLSASVGQDNIFVYPVRQEFKFKEELFNYLLNKNYFKPQVPILMADNIPVLHYYFNENFDYGIVRLLRDPYICNKLRINEIRDANGELFIERVEKALARNIDSESTERKKALETYKYLYDEIYSPAGEIISQSSGGNP
ncbi:hypothetical protein FACS189491_00140 [Spirochaetia bacterium]|nr:hypothetical protein FACS189491_00140 [Spirochaetia bacterium]